MSATPGRGIDVEGVRCPGCGGLRRGRDLCASCAAIVAGVRAHGPTLPTAPGWEVAPAGLDYEPDAILEAELCPSCGADVLRNDPHGAGCPLLCRLCEAEEVVEGDRNGYCVACAAEDAECGK